MFITRIKIKNFKGIKFIDINFEVNKNGIKNDVYRDKFKLVDSFYPVSGVTTFIGQNSVGKSTIINALSFIKDVETGFINQEIANNVIREEIDLLHSKMLSKRPPLVKDSFLELNKISAKKSKDISKEIANKKGISFKKYIFKSTEWFFKFFDKYKHDELDNEILFEVHFLAKNSKYGEYKILLDNEGNITRNVKGDFKINDYQNYFKKVFAPTRTYVFEMQSPTRFSDEKKYFSSYYDFNTIETTLQNMIMALNEKETTNILKLCDENIIGIKYSANQNNSQVVIQNILVKNGKIQPGDLSSGTKQFLILVELIVRAYKTNENYGLLLFDEIEINLHNELIQALIQMLISLFKDFNIQSIITTHNLRSLKPLLSNKQIISIEKNNQKHKVIKASKVMKPHENILTKQEQGLISVLLSTPSKEIIIFF